MSNIIRGHFQGRIIENKRFLPAFTVAKKPYPQEFYQTLTDINEVLELLFNNTSAAKQQRDTYETL